MDKKRVATTRIEIALWLTSWRKRGIEELNQVQPQLPLGKFMYQTPPRTKHFVLERHGHYVNAYVSRASDTQQVLSQMGRQQAELTGKHLRAAHNRVPTRHDVSIYHSDMTRAVETAGIIASDFGEVALSPSSLLREGWPGKPYSSAFVACMRKKKGCDYCVGIGGQYFAI